ncbi:MAG: 2-isopropylmalate synthase [Coriobacteriales bacterium]|nr:2-isopropylmalate synthase [Coriobacteriales bacterium]
MTATTMPTAPSSPRRIKIFDTTLRDGEQAPGCSMNLDEKLSVARQLETLGVDCIEAGFAVSSPGDFESVQAIANTVKSCAVASLARSVTKDIDAAYEALRGAEAPRIHLFIATSPVHMKHKLRMSPEAVLERTVEMVRYAKSRCPDVEFSAEDATRSDRAFLAQVLSAAIKAGATTVNVPDTVGYVTPEELAALVSYLKEAVEGSDEADFSLHCHDDLGMAVANTLAGVRAGATQVECTVNGIGERAGNAALEEVVMALKTRKDLFDCATGIDTTQIYRTSKLVYNVIGQAVPMNKSVVGANAFAHESGIHQHGVMAERSTYEIMSAEDIGLKQNNMVLGKHSGRHAFEGRLSELGYSFAPADAEVFFERFKEICDKKKAVTDSDIEAIVNNRVVEQPHHYRLENFHVHSGKEVTAVCVVTLGREKELVEAVSLGDGPVDAAYNAIGGLVSLPLCELEAYSINSTSDGTDSLGEVVVKLRCEGRLAIGHGLSTDVIEASILAYLNAVNKLLDSR